MGVLFGILKMLVKFIVVAF